MALGESLKGTFTKYAKDFTINWEGRQHFVMHHIYFKSALESSRFIMLPEPRWIFNTSTILKVNAEIQLTDPKLPGQ